MTAPPKRPFLQWYPSNWQADAGLRMCSLAARAVWHELCLIAHECEPYGHVRPGGEIPTVQELAKLIAADTAEVASAIAELERRKVFSRASDGAIYSRKMERDELRRIQNSKNGKSGGNPALRAGDEGRITDRITEEPPTVAANSDKARVRVRERAHDRVPETRDQSLEARDQNQRLEGQREDAPPVAASPPPDPEPPPVQAKPPRKPPTGPLADAIRHWESEWTRTRLGTEYTVQQKDATSTDRLLKLKGSSLDEVRLRMTRMLESPDPFYLRAAEPSLLLSKWPQFAFDVKGPPPPNARDPANSWVAQELARRQQQKEPA